MKDDNYIIQFYNEIKNNLDGEYKIKERVASSDGVWRYIQLCVVPEIIATRWGIENKDRFYKVSRRLYLKILWWNVYL